MYINACQQLAFRSFVSKRHTNLRKNNQLITFLSIHFPILQALSKRLLKVVGIRNKNVIFLPYYIEKK
jgi:hypothetical protein